jgi:hypothetical protein
MKHLVFAVKDTQVTSFAQPFYMQSKGAAIRGFMDAVNQPSQQQQPDNLKLHPEDFNLHHLGEWDDETGTFTNEPDQPVIMRGRDAKREEA